MDRETILKALKRLGELAYEQGLLLDICIYGGSAMMLAYDARDATKDIDAIIHPRETAERLVAKVGEEMGLPAEWLNDDVKFHAAPIEQKRALPLEFRGLRVHVPTASYLLAMKALAAREALPGYGGDYADLAFLMRKIGIRNEDEVQRHLERHYPDYVLSDEARLMIRRILQEEERDASN